MFLSIITTTKKWIMHINQNYKKLNVWNETVSPGFKQQQKKQSSEIILEPYCYRAFIFFTNN